MNDRYLFKAKRVDNGKWVQGYYYQIWENGYILWGMTNDVPNMIEVQAELTKKAPIASPSFTGTPKVPTASAGTNNTQAASTAFVTSAISTAMAGITKLDFQVVQTLPSTGVKGTFYLIANSGRGQNVYDEYLWINNKYEKLGTREIDLSSYIKQSDMVAITNSEIDAAFA